MQFLQLVPRWILTKGAHARSIEVRVGEIASVVQLLQTPTVSCLNVACRASCVLYGSTSSAIKSTQAQQRSMFLSNVSKLIRYVACMGHSLFIDFVCHSDEKRTDHGSRDTLQLILHPSPRPSIDDARAFFFAKLPHLLHFTPPFLYDIGV